MALGMTNPVDQLPFFFGPVVRPAIWVSPDSFAVAGVIGDSDSESILVWTCRQVSGIQVPAVCVRDVYDTTTMKVSALAFVASETDLGIPSVNRQPSGPRKFILSVSTHMASSFFLHITEEASKIDWRKDVVGMGGVINVMVAAKRIESTT